MSRKLNPFTAIICTLMITVSSCGKLDGITSIEVDSPDTERDIKTALLVGTWELIEFDDTIIENSQFFLKFDVNGDYEEYSTDIKDEFSFEGKWEWNVDLSRVLVEYNDGDEAILNVIEIKENQFIFRADGDRYTFEKVE